MSNKTKKHEVDTKAAVQALEYLLAAGYVSKKRLYVENFIRGIFFSVGTILGATIVIALLLWVVSLFSNVPFIGDIARNIQDTITESK